MALSLLGNCIYEVCLLCIKKKKKGAGGGEKRSIDLCCVCMETENWHSLGWHLVHSYILIIIHVK